eukprot:gene14352-17438_t
MATLNYFLFDYDGTLCHTHNTINHAIAETFKEFQLQVPDEQLRLAVIGSGVTINEALVNMYPEGNTLPSEEQIVSMVNSYRAIYNDIDSQYTTLYDGAATLLSSLKENNKIVVVLSNKGFKSVSNSLKFFHLEAYTDLLIADGMIMTGDTHSDLLFAKNCGIKSCWASYGYGDPEACKRLNPDYLIANLDDFSKIFNRLN